MISWRDEASIESSDLAMVKACTMSLFAVRKDDDADRLISWPRTQNDLFLNVTPIDLPDPSLFGRLEIARDAALCGFAIDVSNMFHNIVLPSWMSAMFPMPALVFGNMPGPLQRAVMRALHLTRRPKQSARYIPHQTTSPMGFKWAVHIAHALGDAILKRALAAVRLSLFRPIAAHKLLRASRHIRVESNQLLLLHVIDDINVVACDVDPRVVVPVQRAIHAALEDAGLPIKASKTTPVGSLEYDAVPFIGYAWSFASRMKTPKDGRADEVRVACVERAGHVAHLAAPAYRRFVGKELWLLLCRRPLISTLRVALHPDAVTSERSRRVAARELRQAAQLCTLACIDPCREFSLLVVSSDATPTHGAVVWAIATQHEVRELIASSRYIAGNDADAQHVVSFVQARRWRTAFVHSWEHDAHINALEMAAALMALRWLIRDGVQRKRAILLCDSTVAIGVLAKGRSSSPDLLRYARLTAALSLGHDVDLIPVYVPSASCPADPPSRGLPAPGKVSGT